jgi:hypothetical protein
MSSGVVRRRVLLLAALLIMGAQAEELPTQEPKAPRLAPSPLYRDPIYDGAADPVVMWNPKARAWWMFYTQRRANQESAGVAYCYGTKIGVASSENNGKTWVYLGSLDLDFERGTNTFWAPEIVRDGNRWHMLVTYIRGVRDNWGGKPVLMHYTSENLWEWKREGTLQLPSADVIDPTLFRMPDGHWRMWYKDQSRGSVTMSAESPDLKEWKVDSEPAVGKPEHEGPKVFRYGDWYWMVTDEWRGQRVHRSKDAKTWEHQGLILDKPGKRKDDTPTGTHADVLVVGEKIYIFYFTHPGRENHRVAPSDENGNRPYKLRRSSIHVAEIKPEGETLVCDRDAPFDFFLPDLGSE